MKRILLFFLVILCGGFSLLLFSCGDVQSGSRNLVQINISPTTATLRVGTHESFSATAVYSNGSTVSIVPAWSVSGAIGTIEAIGYTGYFVATQEGSGLVTATYNSKTASATVYVTGESESSRLVTIEVNSSTTLRVGAWASFSAVGTNASGESVSFEATWGITGGVGNFSSSGTQASLEATAEGTAIIRCSSGEVVGYAYVTVEGFSVDITVEADTYVEEASPEAKHSGESSLKAGRDSITGYHYETYLYFTTEAFASARTIESVTLKLYPTTAGSSYLQLYLLAASFNADTVWSNKPALGSFLLSKKYTSGSYNEVSGNELTNAVQNWVTSREVHPDYGLAIIQEGDTAGTTVFLSKENGTYAPMLSVQYKK